MMVGLLNGFMIFWSAFYYILFLHFRSRIFLILLLFLIISLVIIIDKKKNQILNFNLVVLPVGSTCNWHCLNKTTVHLQ